MKDKYTFRFYREKMGKRFITFTMKDGETDLWIAIDPPSFKSKMIEDVKETVVTLRRKLKAYIEKHKEFLFSLSPLKMDPSAPEVVKEMLEASSKAGVGPMAAVAGAIAKKVGESLKADEVIVENGGDIYVRVKRDLKIAIFSGRSRVPHFFGIKVKAWQTPCGICTSSATVGHSLSFGNADSVTILNKNVALADALATKYCNEVKEPHDAERAVRHFLLKESGGITIVIGETVAMGGEMEITKI